MEKREKEIKGTGREKGEEKKIRREKARMERKREGGNERNRGKRLGKGKWEEKFRNRKGIRIMKKGDMKDTFSFGKDFNRKNEKERVEDKVMVHVIWVGFKLMRKRGKGRESREKEKHIFDNKLLLSKTI